MNWDNFRFAQPELLWLLLIIPCFLLLRGKTGRKASILFPSTFLVRQVAAFVQSKPGRFTGWLRALILTFALLALARPQAGEELSKITSSGMDIVLTVDLSTSMWAHDFEINGVPQDRLTVVKEVIREFIEKRPSDRIGLVAFAADPYLISPLTLKHDWLLERLDDLEIGMVTDGTAIGSAVGSSVNRLMDQEAKSRIVILLTDGANNRGQIQPIAAAEAAAAFGIKVYAVGVGREGIVRVPARLDRNNKPARNSDGSIIFTSSRSSIDLKTLEEIAKKTNAHYFHATDSDELDAIYNEIDTLEKTDKELSVRILYSDLFWIPLAAALGLLVLEQAFGQTRYRRLP